MYLVLSVVIAFHIFILAMLTLNVDTKNGPEINQTLFCSLVLFISFSRFRLLNIYKTQLLHMAYNTYKFRR